MLELMDQQCRLVQSLQHQAECPYRYFREYEGMLRTVFYHCWNKSGLVISFGLCIPVKVSVITDNSVIYMKFPKEVPVAGWGKWAILPQFCTTSSFAGMHFFEILHVGCV